MNDSNPKPPLKQCTKCGEFKPETAEFFYWHSTRKHFEARCKDCKRKQGRQYRIENLDQERERTRQWSIKNADKIRERRRQYYAENRDKILERHRQYHRKNADEICERTRQWKIENPDKVREYSRQYYIKNGEKVRKINRRWQIENRDKILERRREYHRQYRIKNADKERERGRKWRTENPDKKRAETHRRRAIKRNADGTHTAADIQLQITSQTNKRGQLICWWCDKVIKDDYHVDHRIPLIKGGSNNADNIVIAHQECNLSKGAKMPHEWNGWLL